MPSLRDSGKLVGQLASLRQVAQQCNLPFPLSLRQFIVAPRCPFTRCIRLHIKVLTEPDRTIDERLDRMREVYGMLNRMREVYRTAGIRVEVVSWEELTADVLGNNVFTDLNDLDVGPCRLGQPSNEQNRLFQNQNNVPAGERNNVVVVYFVRSVLRNGTENLNGCASFPNGQPGAAVAQIASQWTLGHEVGHVMGLPHIAGEHQGCPASNPECCSTPDHTRLMTGCSTSAIVGTPTVAQSEINTMTSSNLTRQC